MRPSAHISIWLYCLLMAAQSYGQLDTVHYFPPFHASEHSLGEQFFFLSTPSNQNIEIEVLDSYGYPVEVLTISNRNPESYFVGTNNDSRVMTQQTELAIALQNKGYIFRSDDYFYCNYRVIAHPQSGSITCKGTSAVGYRFRPGHMINSHHYSYRSNSVSMMALEDAEIKISNLPDDLILRNIQIDSGELHFQLNKGETIVLSEYFHITAPNNVQGFLGSLIESTGEIVVNCGSYTGGNVEIQDARDIGFDQIIPMHMAGKEFICIRGNGFDLMENVIIVIDRDSTILEVNGFNYGKFDAGDYVVLPENYYSQDDNMYVKANEPIVLYQMIGGFTYYPTYGMNFIPALNCLTDTIVDNIPFYNRIGTFNYTGNIIVTARKDAAVRRNGVLIPRRDAQPVTGNSDYVTYKIADDYSSTHLSISSSAEIQVGLFGANGLVGFAAYFSGFTEPPNVQFEGISFSKTLCFDQLNSQGNYERIEWYFNDSLVAINIDSFATRGKGEYKAVGFFTGCTYKDSITVTHPGVDTVYIVEGACSNQDTGLFVYQDVSSINCDSVTIKKVFKLRSERLRFINYTCSLPDQNFDTLFYLNSEGCDSLHIIKNEYVGLDSFNQFSEICEGEWIEFEENYFDRSGTYCRNYISAYGCDSTRCLKLNVVPNFSHSTFDTICWNEYYIFEGDTLHSSGTFSTTYSGVTYCDSTIILELCVLDDPNPQWIDPPNFCLGDSVLIEISFGPNHSIEWEDGNLQPKRSFVSEQSTFFILSNNFGCSESFSIDIQEPIDISASILEVSNYNGFNISCHGLTDGWIEIQAIGSPEHPYNYQWSNGSKEHKQSNLAAGTYKVQVSDQIGCKDTLSMTITQPDPLSLITNVQDIDCLHDLGHIYIERMSGGIPNYEMYINESMIQTNNISGLPVGTYNIECIDRNGCKTNEELEIKDSQDSLHLNILGRERIPLGDDLHLRYQASYDLADWQWISSDSNECVLCDEWELKPLKDLVFELWAVDERGCETMARKSVSVFIPESVFIPNSFSPNGDGTNDLFIVYANPAVERINEYKIFNRWGGLIYKATHLDPNYDLNYWDGQYLDKPLNPGVFVYTIEVEYIDGLKEKFTGDVTLFR